MMMIMLVILIIVIVITIHNDSNTDNTNGYIINHDDSNKNKDFRVIPRSVWRDEFGGRIGEYPCEIA